MDHKELLELFEGVSEDKQEKIMDMLREAVYSERESTLDDLFCACKNENWKSKYGRIEEKVFTRYRAKVMMAMYYVQTFQIMRFDENHASPLWRERMQDNWAPYLGEVCKKLQLSEGEIFSLACLYHFYFIPKAENDCGVRIEDWHFRRLDWKADNYEAEVEKECFEISRVKDLAKIYMMQRFDRRMCRYAVPRRFDCEDKEQFWRDILAMEETSDKKAARMKYGFQKELTGNKTELRYSVCMHMREITDKKDSVLAAYEKLLKKAEYSEVMAETGLSFKEVRILDCFAVAYAYE